MSKVYLIDTCVWRDFYENRLSKSGKPLGEYATKLFLKILKNKNRILYSEALVRELKRDYSEKDIDNMLGLLIINKILSKIDIAKEEYDEAKELMEQRKLPFIDCLNAVQARNHNAVMVSQDKDYKNLSDVVKTLKPEEVS